MYPIENDINLFRLLGPISWEISWGGHFYNSTDSIHMVGCYNGNNNIINSNSYLHFSVVWLSLIQPLNATSCNQLLNSIRWRHRHWLSNSTHSTLPTPPLSWLPDSIRKHGVTGENLFLSWINSSPMCIKLFYIDSVPDETWG